MEPELSTSGIAITLMSSEESQLAERQSYPMVSKDAAYDGTSMKPMPDVALKNAEALRPRIFDEMSVMHAVATDMLAPVKPAMARPTTKSRSEGT
jgi:hypothetical protein